MDVDVRLLRLACHLERDGALSDDEAFIVSYLACAHPEAVQGMVWTQRFIYDHGTRVG